MLKSRLWRGIAVAAAAAGLAGAGTAPAVAATTAATSHATSSGITINTKSRHAKVSGDTLVVYRSTTESSATVYGNSANDAGDTAHLLAKPHGTSSFAAAGSTTVVSGGGYSFTVKPEVATAYEVQVTTPSQTKTSATRMVYVTPLARVTGVPKTCARPVCHVNLKVWVSTPPASLSYEMSKKWFLYSALNLSLSHEPAAPYWLHLNNKATHSKPEQTHPYQFEVTVHYAFRISGKAYKWRANFCTRDVERKDGIGVPGHHGCGDPKIRANAPYLG